MSENEPIRIVLTPEQRELVKRLSGQHVDAIELKADEGEATGGPLKFLWRLSAATGIPRQAWARSDNPEAPSAKEKPSE